MSLLSYNSLKLQSYFKSSLISAKQAKSIFKFRTHMANVKENFHFMYKDTDLKCPECFQSPDTQVHLLAHSDGDIDNTKYSNIFRRGYHKDKVLISKIMDQVLNRRAVVPSNSQITENRYNICIFIFKYVLDILCMYQLHLISAAVYYTVQDKYIYNITLNNRLITM